MIYEDPNNYQLELDDYNGTLISLIPLMSKLACRVFANSSFIAGKQEKHFSASRYPRSGFLSRAISVYHTCTSRAKNGPFKCEWVRQHKHALIYERFSGNK